jgi:hypothetical protein
MVDGIVLSLYGLGTVFASLVSFAGLVAIMQRTLGKPPASTPQDGEEHR